MRSNGSRPVRTLILCGGKGTRAYPHTAEIPKPLMEVADRPILERVMAIYARQGFTDFVLATGYKGEEIEAFAETLPEAWRVTCLDTGDGTNTGGRARRAWPYLGDTFFLTYSDGLGNVDLRALFDFHASHPGAATLTTVPLPSQYGTIDTRDDGRIERFNEKPVLPDHWINAGFMVFDRRAIAHWAGEDLENDVLPALADAGELYAYRHEGFWRSMDTYKDALSLSALCDDGREPWMSFGTLARS